MNKEDLEKILKNHLLFLQGSQDGIEANLRGAYLYGADLYGANLRGANLYGANLSGANLCGTKGVLSFTGEKHLLVYFKTSGIYYMKIGCITKPIETWISNFKNIGRSEGYSEEHIKLYGEVVKLFSTYEITEEE